MSMMYDYYFIKSDRMIEKEHLEVLFDVEFKQEDEDSDLCDTGVVRDYYLGKVNGGTLIMGPSISYFLTYDKELKQRIVELIDGDEVFCKFYDDRVMSFGFVILKNGTISRISGYDEEIISLGAITEIEKEVYLSDKKLESDLGIDKYEIPVDLAPEVLMKSINKYEIQYFGKEFDDIDCKCVELKKYKLR